MDDKIYEIIAQIIAGENVGDDDKAELQGWLEESAEHRKLFESFTCFYERGENFRRLGGVDHELAYQKICRSGQIHSVSSSGTRVWKFSAIAAVVILIIGVAIAVFRNNQEVPGKETEVCLVRNSGKVQLKLENGKSIDLASGGKQVLESETGQIALRDSNLLNYQSVAAANVNAKIEYNTLIVPVGAEYRLVLSDGTRVHMNAASELYYPTVFAGNRREVILKGEAYFEVTRDSVRQFVVRAGGIDIQVLGTSFNVSANEDAHQIAATLVSGKIRALSDGKAYDIVPGEQFRKNIRTGRIEIEKVNTGLYTCWKDGYYYFEDCPLGDIMQTLRRWYDIDVVFTDPMLNNIKFTGRLKRYEDVNELFRKFEYTRNISFSRKENTVVVGVK